MASNKYFEARKKHINCAEQALFLDKKWPGIKRTTVLPGRMIWIGNLSPTPLSMNYIVKINYKMKNRPNILILNPEIEQYNDQKIPHRFDDDTLCLFRFKYKEWDYSDLISDTIVPWTITWLYYYEMWLTTGIWYGKGEHPRSKSG